jgi:nitrite reductase (cytochrome c-552)
VLKAQHPEFEMWNQGHPRALRCDLRRLPHALTSAKARSRSATTTCAAPCSTSTAPVQTCHKWPEEELKARIETIQAAHL